MLDAAADTGSTPQLDAGGDSDALIGWAAVDGDQVATTTGGLGGREVTPTSVQELIDYAVSADPLVIIVDRAFDVPRLNITSNKSLIGVGDNAQINGGIRIRGDNAAFVTNVIVSRVRVHGATSDVDGDALQIYYAHHVWIDHCEIWDAPDGNLDIVHASNWVTVSWCKFRYSDNGPDPNHRFCNLIGHTDANDEDIGRLKVTFHHNWWAEGVVERMPRVRHGQVHAFNNLYASVGNNYAIGAGVQAQLLIENNVFDGVSNPHLFYADEPTAQIVQSGNLYLNATGDRDEGQGASFDPPYPYTLDPVDQVATDVQQHAGP